ncbi:MOSC domain-containing protein [Azohydromonas aeria]|uniref:MOSC domain-containing protein n=1 Tax=Azohydromonas aeria TaxID=2590212 RepID=UPI0012FBECCC|nr:MOSC domain-containing protein [Azohydromonas aeria]
MRILSLNTLVLDARGAAEPRRRPTAEPHAVERYGLDGEPPAATPARALYAYPIEHYPLWQTLRAQARAAEWGEPLPHGALGEALTLQGLTEAQACVGDVLVFDSGCELAVSEPHVPGPELDAALGFRHAARMMWQSAFCGFHLGVRVGGTLRSGDRFTLRPGPRDVNIAELFRQRRG